MGRSTGRGSENDLAEPLEKPRRQLWGKLWAGVMVVIAGGACTSLVEPPADGLQEPVIPVVGGEKPAPDASRPALPSLPFLKQTMPVDAVAQHQGQTVEIVGEVQRQVPLVNRRLYQVQDSTASIWVEVTQADSPEIAVGDRITAKGIVAYQEIQISGSNLSEYYLQADRIQTEADN
ncbi:MAG: hypothetical protein AAFZ80_06275 [Cyanobacteria bacterium P01_A01_bin.105]